LTVSSYSAGFNRSEWSRVFCPDGSTETARCRAQAWAGQVFPESDARPHDGGAGREMWVSGGGGVQTSCGQQNER